jgi:hypothetical protein
MDPLTTDRSQKHFENVLRHSRKMLARWHGADGLLLDASISHCGVRFVLSRTGQDGNLLVSCGATERITAPFRWSNSRVELSGHVDPTDGDAVFVLSDETAGLEVVCGVAEIKGNVKLPWEA